MMKSLDYVMSPIKEKIAMPEIEGREDSGILLFGGYNANTMEASPRCAYYKYRTWNSLPDVPHSFMKASCVALKGFVFVCGGCVESVDGSLFQKTMSIA